MTIEVQMIAVSIAGRPVAIMSIVASAPAGNFSPADAAANGFVLSGDGTLWEREVTDEIIEAEIARTPAVVINTGWQRVDIGNLPADRVYRDAWELS